MTILWIRAFQIVLRRGRQVSPRCGQVNHIFIYFPIKENFFKMTVGTWRVILNLFQSQKQLHLKSKFSMICVSKYHEIKTKKVQEQQLQLKIKFSLGYITWKLLFRGEDAESNPWCWRWGEGSIKISWERGVGGSTGRIS